ncbi:MAG TPA: bifunctional phosphoribosylaminoimidazolecarboxamide formyltransferase/IMP cyclohydrolase, partial [Candidatus Acidoferrales bacterium]|nr:bifunctional phosphoribosylaminoimidazolecarboxamide formyltransferase/IMP cyclohydrolase [Candidatus Acidoferrales bacterium]
GEVKFETRLELARKAYAATSRYDGLIAMELERVTADGAKLAIGERTALPQRLHVALIEKQAMRYGENPHQQAALYAPAGVTPSGFAAARQLQGKELSYNNLADLDSAWRLVQEFREPAVAIIKHNNPCGVAERGSIAEAYLAALECDPDSAFGGVIAVNRELNGAAAEEIAKLFTECIAAPEFSAEALAKFSAKKNLRLLEMPGDGKSNAPGNARDSLELRRIAGGVLVQTPDMGAISEGDLKKVTAKAPTPEQMRDLLFAWRVCKHVKSNAIVFARGGATIGIGAGQMSRVDSVKIAISKARSSLAGTALASDAFFPFPDSIEEAAKAGAKSVIQPGGSVRDAEVIEVANRLGLAMIFTGMRHFRH